MDAGRVLATDTPANLVAARGAATLEEAFIGYLEEATAARATTSPATSTIDIGAFDYAETDERGRNRTPAPSPLQHEAHAGLCEPRSARTAARSDLAVFALLGTAFLMIILRLRHHDGRRQYVLRGARRRSHARKAAPISPDSAAHDTSPKSRPSPNHAELDRRLRNGELQLAIEIPPGFGRDLKHGRRLR